MGKIFVFTGARGTGKTTLARTFLPPSQQQFTFWHDSERSADNVIKELEKAKIAFGHYANLSSRLELPPEDDLLKQLDRGVLPWRTKAERTNLEALWDWIIGDLNEHLERGKFKVYVHDTVTKLEAAMVAWADAHSKALGVRGSSKGSPWGEFWNAGVYELYDQLFEGIFARGVETIILTSHLKNVSENNKSVPGKVTVGGKPWLTMQTSLMLWLVNANNDDGAPAGLVLKERMGKLEPNLETDKWEPRRMLPKRIPHCTWNDIERYLQDGCNLNNPAPGEALSREEFQMISPLLTNEQMRLMVLDAEAEVQRLRLESAPMLGTGAPLDVGAMQDPQEEARSLAEEGLEPAAIAEQLSKPLPLVKRWLEESKE